MKKIYTLLFFCLICMMEIHAQWSLIDNKGNRLQTYPAITETNPEIMAMMNQVDTINLYNSVLWMQQYIREASSPEALLTQEWLLNQYEEMGLETQIQYLLYEYLSPDTLDAGNVIAIQRGTVFPDEYVIISSHYDHPDGPGADDNASGTAGVLECARILSQYSFKRSILYINFNCEEVGLFGSSQLATKYATEDKDILGVFNLDMIGFWPSETDSITMYASRSTISEKLFDFYSNVANIYRPDMPTFSFSEGEHGGGDHEPFKSYDYPAIYIGDVENLDLHPCYHTPCDTIGSGLNSFALAEGFTQATLAAAAELANGWLPPQDFSAIPNNDNIILSWEMAENTAYYKLFRDNELIAEPTDNYFEDYQIEQGVDYEYFVKAVKADMEESAESNHDIMRLSEPLVLPIIEDFEDNLNNFYFNLPTWQLTDTMALSGNFSLINDLNFTSRSYWATAELYYFSIPDTVQDASLSFSCKNLGYWPSTYNIYFSVEVTTDRKTWHKLLNEYSVSYMSWKLHELSLNDFIGEPYLQMRFSIKGNGPEAELTSSRTCIDDLKIDFSPITDVPEIRNTVFKDFCLSPNPASSQIEISTDLLSPYAISIYNINGIRVMQKNDFSDGILDVSSLPKGTYLVMINVEGNCIAKKIILN